MNRNNRKATAAAARFMRSRVQPMLRRGVAHVGPVERVLARNEAQLRTLERLLAMYEALRRAYVPNRVRPARLPRAAQIKAVQEAVLSRRTFTDFFQKLSIDGDLERAAVETTRDLIAGSELSRARCIAQVFERYEELRPVAEVCLALCAYVEPMPDTAWTLLSRNDVRLVVRRAANEYFQLAFQREPDAAAATLSRVLSGELPLQADPDIWVQIAYHAFSAGCHDVAGRTVDRAVQEMSAVTDPVRIERLRERTATLREWLAQAARRAEPVAAAGGEVPFALVGFRHPDWGEMSLDLSDPAETLAVLGHLVRHDGVRFTGEPDLVSCAERLRGDVPAERRISGAGGAVRLYEVDRDVSRYAVVPDGTWIVVSDWFTLPLAGVRYDIPLDPRLRPIFISFHITPKELAAPGAIEYLREHGPIGCRDWDTVFLLHAAGVPAFFSGALAATVDTVLRVAASREPTGTLFVDTEPDGPGQRRSRMSAAMRSRTLGENITAAAAWLRSCRDAGKRIVTSDVRCYLATRALGCPAELRPDDLGDSAVADVMDLGDADFAAVQRGISDKLAAVLRAVLAGESEAEVYAAWRAQCAPDVAAAEAELHSITGDPDLNFDLQAACRVIRSASVTIERSQPGPDGSEVNVEFSIDQNYKHQLDIVLDSVVERASRPIRAFILCRGLGQADFDRLARLFPTVSFVWLPTDNVDYGPIPEKIKWATIVTMDRTMLPVLLGEVDRIIHFDLDALCLGDLAELFDVDLEGTAIGAVDAPQPNYIGGLDTFRRAARRLRREGRFDVARELIIRTHAQHPFDFEIFNAGIMVLDLAKMRADDVCGRYLGYIQRFGLNGQVIMNLYVGRARKKVDADWNRLMRMEVVDSPKVAHWAGPYKPWRPHQYVYGRELWRVQEDRFAARTARSEAAGVAG